MTTERHATTAAERTGNEHAAPALTFDVTGAEPMRCAAVPALRFQLGISRAGGGPIRSITLTTEIRIAAARRRYRSEEADLLVELFGTPRQWATTMRPLPWARTTTAVAPFSESTVVELPVECSHDVGLAVTKYFHAVRDDEVPLDFLFSGTLFYVGADGGLGTAQISWSTDTTFRLPAELWHEATGSGSAGDSWLRLSQQSFERLYAYRSRHALPDWDTTINALVENTDSGTGTAP